MEPALDRVSAIFDENLETGIELGASVSVWKDGQEILDRSGGFRDRERKMPWSADTRVLVWSATKGPASACVLHALEARGLDLETRVAEFWPGFGNAGKEAITYGQVLSHQAGLSALDSAVDVFDHDAVVDALERQDPVWDLGTTHGYHPRTFGFLLDEMVRSLAWGQPLGEYWREHFLEPLGLSFWIGLPDSLVNDTASIFPARTLSNRESSPFLDALSSAGSLTARSFGSPRGLSAVSSMNEEKARKASLPGFGGVGTARSLGKFYAMLANGGTLDERRYLSQSTIEWMEETRVSGPDSVLCMDTAFSAGFMKDPISSDGKKSRMLFGPSRRAFGQPGAGGSLAFADPENRIAFAYVMNRMEPGVLPGERSLKMVRALYGDPEADSK